MEEAGFGKNGRAKHPGKKAKVCGKRLQETEYQCRNIIFFICSIFILLSRKSNSGLIL